MGYAEWPGRGMAWQDGLEWYGTVQGRVDLGSGGGRGGRRWADQVRAWHARPVHGKAGLGGMGRGGAGRGGEGQEVKCSAVRSAG